MLRELLRKVSIKRKDEELGFIGSATLHMTTIVG